MANARLAIEASHTPIKYPPIGSPSGVEGVRGQEYRLVTTLILESHAGWSGRRTLTGRWRANVHPLCHVHTWYVCVCVWCACKCLVCMCGIGDTVGQGLSVVSTWLHALMDLSITQSSIIRGSDDDKG